MVAHEWLRSSTIELFGWYSILLLLRPFWGLKTKQNLFIHFSWVKLLLVKSLLVLRFLLGLTGKLIENKLM
jgi:hypothetical protein